MDHPGWVGLWQDELVLDDTTDVFTPKVPDDEDVVDEICTKLLFGCGRAVLLGHVGLIANVFEPMRIVWKKKLIQNQN